jgi:hypothetical protein
MSGRTGSVGTVTVSNRGAVMSLRLATSRHEKVPEIAAASPLELASTVNPRGVRSVAERCCLVVWSMRKTW